MDLKKVVLEKSIPEPNTGCWLWSAGTSRAGYGVQWVSDRKKAVVASRASFEAFVAPLEPGEIVMHKCDTPACVNPDHLMSGSHLDNASDRERKGRGRRVFGDQHWSRTSPANLARGSGNGNFGKGAKGFASVHCKVDESTAREVALLHAAGHSTASLARRFGVARPSIDRALKRLEWKG